MKIYLAGHEIETNYKVLYATTLRCDFCRGTHLLRKVEDSHGDKQLRCFNCTPNLRWYQSTPTGSPKVEPYDKIHFASQQKQCDRQLEVYEAITTDNKRYEVRRGRPKSVPNKNMLDRII